MQTSSMVSVPTSVIGIGSTVSEAKSTILQTSINLIKTPLERGAKSQITWVVMSTVMMSGVAAAQEGGGGGASGICGMPGGSSLVPLVMNFVAGALVLGGVLMFGYGMLSITTNRQYGTSGRTIALLGIGALAIGLVFNQVPGWMAGVMGSDLASLGLQCLGGGGGG